MIDDWWKQQGIVICFVLNKSVKMTSIASIPRKLPLLLVTEDVLLPGSSIRVSVTSSAKWVNNEGLLLLFMLHSRTLLCCIALYAFFPLVFFLKCIFWCCHYLLVTWDILVLQNVHHFIFIPSINMVKSRLLSKSSLSSSIIGVLPKEPGQFDSDVCFLFSFSLTLCLLCNGSVSLLLLSTELSGCWSLA